MTAFGRFAIALTVLYVLYYAIIIIRDLYTKKEGEKTDEEEFDVSSMEDTSEQAVGVKETENGFELSSMPSSVASVSNGNEPMPDNGERDEKHRRFVQSGLGNKAVEGEKNPDRSISEAEQQVNASEVKTKQNDLPKGKEVIQQTINRVQGEMESITPNRSLMLTREALVSLFLDADKKGSLFNDAPATNK